MKYFTNSKLYNEYWTLNKSRFVEQYCQNKTDFIHYLLPSTAVQLPVVDTLEILKKRYGILFETAIFETHVSSLKTNTSPPIFSKNPVSGDTNSDWIKRANIVGINVRTIGNFWNIVNYMFTIPAHQNAVHLLPIWEPGVVGSLYGMSSWHINREFFNDELARVVPHLDTVEKQLRAVINILHLMGKAVGMDVIPHTDRYSEIALANPHFFEWLQRFDLEIVNHSADLYKTVQQEIWNFLSVFGCEGKSKTKCL